MICAGRAVGAMERKASATTACIGVPNHPLRLITQARNSVVPLHRRSCVEMICGPGAVQAVKSDSPRLLLREHIARCSFCRVPLTRNSILKLSAVGRIEMVGQAIIVCSQKWDCEPWVPACTCCSSSLVVGNEFFVSRVSRSHIMYTYLDFIGLSAQPRSLANGSDGKEDWGGELHVW
jgi:hypothetical protein